MKWNIRFTSVAVPRIGLMSAVVAALLAACSAPAPAGPGAGSPEAQAMLEGAARARECRAQIDDDTYEFGDCLRLRLQARPAGDESLVRAHRLGVAFWGWYVSDVGAGFALPGAESLAREMRDHSRQLIDETATPETALCPLIETPCKKVLDRWHEVAHPRA
jgi:hypothetical protein